MSNNDALSWLPFEDQWAGGSVKRSTPILLTKAPNIFTLHIAEATRSGLFSGVFQTLLNSTTSDKKFKHDVNE